MKNDKNSQNISFFCYLQQELWTAEYSVLGLMNLLSPSVEIVILNSKNKKSVKSWTVICRGFTWGAVIANNKFFYATRAAAKSGTNILSCHKRHSIAGYVHLQSLL